MPDDDRLSQDRELVRRCLAGEPAAWSELVESHFPFLSGVVRRTLRDHAERDDPERIADLLHDTFVFLYRDDARVLRTFRWRCPLRHYLAMVAEGRSLNALARRKPRPVDPDGLRRLIDGTAVAPSVLPIETGDQVRQAIGKLPARERLAVLWHYWDGLPPETIGRLLALAPGSVRTLLTRARQTLRDAMKGRLPIL